MLTLPSGRPMFPPMEEGATIPFRRIIPPPLPNGRQPDTPPVPSAHLLYVRETLVRIAHLVGAAGVWDDDEEESDDGDYVDLEQSDGHESLSRDDGDGPRTPPSAGMERETSTFQTNLMPELPGCRPSFLSSIILNTSQAGLGRPRNDFPAEPGGGGTTQI
jgi:hypothetical protein